MFEFARVAEEYGSGELRMTVEQNFVIPNVPDDKVEALLADPLLKKFTPFPSNLSANLVGYPFVKGRGTICGWSRIRTP